MSELKEILFQACERELNRYHSADVAGLANEYAEWEMKRLRTRHIP